MNIKEAKEMALKEYKKAAESGEVFKVKAVTFKSDYDMAKQLMPEVIYGQKNRRC